MKRSNDPLSSRGKPLPHAVGSSWREIRWPWPALVRHRSDDVSVIGTRLAVTPAVA
jgi:hypothetical protein